MSRVAVYVADALDPRDPLDRNHAAAIKAKAIAYSEGADCCVCAGCLALPSAREDREVLGMLRIATSEDIDRTGYCVGVCGRDLCAS